MILQFQRTIKCLVRLDSNSDTLEESLSGLSVIWIDNVWGKCPEVEVLNDSTRSDSMVSMGSPGSIDDNAPLTGIGDAWRECFYVTGRAFDRPCVSRFIISARTRTGQVSKNVLRDPLMLFSKLEPGLPVWYVHNTRARISLIGLTDTSLSLFDIRQEYELRDQQEKQEKLKTAVFTFEFADIRFAKWPIHVHFPPIRRRVLSGGRWCKRHVSVSRVHILDHRTSPDFVVRVILSWSHSANFLPPP